VRYFKSFIQDYPDAVGIRLSKNYRSTQLILDAAQQMIQSQHGKTIQDRLLSQTKKGKKIQIIECEDEKSEAVYIGKKIEQLTGGFGFHSIDFGRIDFEEGSAEIGFSDFAVLFRTAKQAEIIAEVFQKAGIPFQRVSKEESSVEPTVAAIISILKLTEKKGSFIDFERVAAVWKPGISVATMERWKRWAFTKRFSFEQAMEKTRKIPIKPLKREQQLKFDLFYREIRKLSAELHMLSIKKKIIKIIEQGRIVSKDRSNPKKMDIIQAFIRLSEAYDDDTERFFKKISLQSDVDTYQEKAHKVALMTIHSAKGLEFPVVFVIGCEDGFHPHHRAKGEVETAEEKRLLYVAMTRAKQQLYISFCRYRTVFGKRQQREASPFLRAIDRRLIEFLSSNKEKSKRHQQLRLF
jgi:DNA helicase-2/ATP-dependent DNA helicase PcrA